MREITYVGTADVRILSTSDFQAAGINDQAGVTWDKDNPSRVVSDLAAAFLLAQPLEFEDESGLSFADLQQTTGKEIGYGGTNVLLTMGATETDAAGVVCTLTPGGDPFKLVLSSLVQLTNNTAGPLTMIGLIKVYDITAGGAGVQKMQITLRNYVINGNSFLNSIHKERVIRDAPAGVQRSYKVTHQVTTAGTGIMWASEAFGETFLQAVGC